MDNTILQWNCNGLYAHLEEVKLLISKRKPFVICLQETLLKPNKIFKLFGYNTYRTDGEYVNKARGGVAICVDSRIRSDEVILNNCNLEIVCVKVFFPVEITICNCYIPPDTQIHLHDLQNIKNQITGPCIFLGDFNAHNVLWGSTSLNVRGQIIENFIDNNDLIILNSNMPTHLNTHSGNTSIIDLAIVTPVLSTLFWFQTNDDLCSSDHYPIWLSMYSSVLSESRRPRWILDKADWKSYATQVSFDQTYTECDDVDNINLHITEQIIRAANTHIPCSSGKTKKNSVPWWSPEVEYAIKRRKSALKNFNQYPTETNLTVFRRLKARARFLIRQAKTAAWHNFSSSINSQTSSSTVWKSVGRISGRSASLGIKSLKINDIIITSQAEIASELGSFYEQVSNNSSYPPEFIVNKNYEEAHFRNPNDIENQAYNSDFSIIEFESALQTCTGSSPGPDNIQYAMIKNIDISAKKFILLFFNKIWKSNNFPKAWRDAYIIPIPKPNGNRVSPEGYRPICLTNCICKLMEKMVNRRLVWYLESNSLFFQNQFGFRKKKSTADNLSVLESHIQIAFSKQECLVGILLDLEQAYNRAWRLNIIKSCIELKIQGNLLNFVMNFLKERSFRVLLGNIKSEVFVQQNGVPQGSILSVVLFLIHLNSLKNLNFPRGVNLLLYADDILIYGNSKDVFELRARLQETLNLIHEWSKGIGLVFCPRKSKAIVFSRQRNPAVMQNFNLNNTDITFESKIKYLGLWFDSKLTWRPHITQIKAQCQMSLNVLRVLSNTNWGADRTILLRIFQALVVSKINYGSVAYSSARNSILQKINPIYNQGLRLSTGALRSSPIESLNCVSGFLPLSKLRERELLNFLLKVSKEQVHPLLQYIGDDTFLNVFDNKPSVTKPFIYRSQALARNVEFDPINVEKISFGTMPPWLINHGFFVPNVFPIKSNSHPREICSIFQKLVSAYPNYVKIFTDGSKNDLQTGIGIFSPFFEFNARLPDYTDIFIAELLAISKALELLSQRTETHFMICTDSMSSIQALQKIYDNHPIITKIHDQLLKASENKSIKLCWVPGHSGIHGNEKADELANKGRNNRLIAEGLVGVSRFNAKTFLKKLRQQWNEDWVNLSSNKLRTIQASINIPKFPSNITRKDSVILTRLRIGHTILTHKHLYTREPPPICETCNCQITVAHIFNDCLKYNAVRTKYQIDHQSLVVESKMEKCILFVRECNLYSKI